MLSTVAEFWFTCFRMWFSPFQSDRDTLFESRCPKPLYIILHLSCAFGISWYESCMKVHIILYSTYHHLLHQWIVINDIPHHTCIWSLDSDTWLGNVCISWHLTMGKSVLKFKLHKMSAGHVHQFAVSMW